MKKYKNIVLFNKTNKHLYARVGVNYCCFVHRDTLECDYYEHFYILNGLKIEEI